MISSAVYTPAAQCARRYCSVPRTRLAVARRSLSLPCVPPAVPLRGPVMGGVAATVAPHAARSRMFATKARLSTKDWMKREAKILVGLAVATFGVSVYWQYTVQVVPPDVKAEVQQAAKARNEGNLPLAVQKYKKALFLLEQGHASDEYQLFEAFFSLGDVHMDMQKPVDSMSYFRQANSVCMRMLKDFSSRRLRRQMVLIRQAVTLDRMAQLRHNSGDLELAITLYSRAVRAASSFEPNPENQMMVLTSKLELAGILNNRARARIASQDFDGAEDDAMRVMELCKHAKKVKMGTRAESVEVETKWKDVVEAKRQADKGMAPPEAVVAAVHRAKGRKGKRKGKRAEAKAKRQSIVKVARELLGDVQAARRAAGGASSAAAASE